MSRSNAASTFTTLKTTWECVRAMSRAFATAALAAAIALALTATASAQWSPGGAYNAVTLGSGEYFSTNSTYSQSFASRALSIETWVKFDAGVNADMEIAETFDTAFREGASLYAEWNGSNGYTVNMLGVGSFGNDAKTVTNATVMVPGQWYHIVGQYTSSTLNVYVDGTGATPVNWGAGQGPSGGLTLNRNTLGRAQNSGLASTFSGELTGFRIWDGSIGTPSEPNSAVTASPNYAGVTLLANFQAGTDGVIPSTSIGNGSITALTGSTGGTLNATNAANASLAKYGAGTIAVTTDSYFLDSISAGILDLGNGGATGTLITDVTNDATLSFNRNNALTFGNQISGTGIVSQDGSGTTTLSGNNSYAGATNVNAGTLRVTHVNGLGTTAAGTSVASGATLELAPLTNPEVWAEDITLNGGTLSTVTGGTVNVTGAVVLSADSLLSTATDNTADELTLSGVISGAGGFTFSGNAATLTNTNTYDGNTIINSGAVFVKNGALGSTTGTTQVNAPTVPMGGLVFDNTDYTVQETVSLNGGYIASAGNSSFAGNISVDAFSAIGEGSSHAGLTLSGNISGSAALQIGSSGVGYTGTVTLTGDNTYTGALSIASGTLQIGDGGSTGSVSSISGLANGGTLVYNRNNALNVGYAITGTGSLTQAGSGVLTLSGTNVYTGDTNVTAGTLNIASPGTLTSNVIVGASGTLIGSGSSTGSLSGTGTVAPGINVSQGDPGILTFASLNPSAGMEFNLEFKANDPNYSNATNSENDVIRLTGGTPFTSSLGASNAVNVYLNVDTHFFGKQYRGGFFTDVQSDFIADLQNATFTYYLKDAGGLTSYNGVNYRNITGSPWILTTVPATANFGGGDVNGQVFQVVPEPSTFALLGMGVAGLAAAGYRRRKAAALAKTIA